MTVSKLLLCSMVVVLAACRKDPPPAAAAESPPAPPEVAAPAMPATAPGPATPLEPDITMSLFRVRVTIGSTAQKEFPGVLLHHSAVLKGGEGSPLRFVLAHLPGYDERKLRQKACSIQLLRRKVDDNGQSYTGGFKGWLLRLDPASGLALLGGTEKFEYGDDAGLMVARDAAATDVIVARTFYTLADGSGLPQGRSGWVLNSEGSRSHHDPHTHEVRLPEWTEREGGTLGTVVLNGSRLAGFLPPGPDGPDGAGGVGKLVAVGGFDLSFGEPTLAITGIEFRDQNAYAVVRYDFAHMPATQLRVVWTDKSPEALYEKCSTPNKRGDFKHLGEAGLGTESHLSAGSLDTDRMTDKNAGQETVPLHIYVPFRDGEEKTVVLQPCIGGLEFPLSAGRPVLMKLRRQAGGIYPTITGLPQAAPSPTQDPAAPGGAEKRLTLESKVVQAFPMRGGAEVLFHLENAPFWRRYSFEKNDWMPLPPVASAAVRMAGSSDSLYLLDPSNQTVQKFSSADLRPGPRMQLPPGKDCMDVLTGGASARAPVHVVHPEGTFSLAPEDLRITQDSSTTMHASKYVKWRRGVPFWVSGDGVSLAQHSPELSSVCSYFGDSFGVRFGHPVLVKGPYSKPCGVSGAFRLSDLGLFSDLTQPLGGDRYRGFEWQKTRADLAGMDATSPVIFNVARGDTSKVPPTPGSLQFFSLFDPRPFLKLDAPELVPMSSDPLARRVFLESSSMKVGTLAQDGLTWTVRDVAHLVKKDVPVLLNWPDTVMKAGESYEFQARTSGVAALEAEVVNRPGTVALKGADGAMTIRIAPDEFAPVLLLRLTLRPKEGNPVVCQIPLMLTGETRPILVSPGFQEAKLPLLDSGIIPPSMEATGIRAVPFRTFVSPEPIQGVVGMVGDFAILQVGDDKIQFLSLKSGEVARTLNMPNSRFFAGADALYCYSRTTRELSRVSVPAGQVESSLPMPQGLELAGLGVGQDVDSPLSLLLEATLSQEDVIVGGYQYSFREFRRQLVVMDNGFDKNRRWAAPVLQQSLLQPGSPQRPAGIDLYMGGGFVRLPTSFNGRVVTLPAYQAVLGTQFSTLYRLASDSQDLFHHVDGPWQPSGSMSGIMAASAKGYCCKAGMRLTDPNSGIIAYVEPSGRYKWAVNYLRELNTDGQEWYPALDLRIVETDQRMARLVRLPILSQGYDMPSGGPSKRVFALNQQGVVAMLSASGRTLQWMDMDYQALLKSMAPDALHVVSQPLPHAAEGQTYEYQVKVSNPEALQECRLQLDVPGATLTPQGLLRYVQPPEIRAPSKVQFTIEVKDKNGVITIHAFPVQILAVPQPAKPAVKPPVKVNV